MGDRDAAIGIAADAVVVAHVVVDGHVHVSFLTRVKDFTRDLQLCRRDRTIQKLRQDFPKAVDALDFNARVVRIADRDADIQHQVAVDDIVAAASLDHVAAGTAKQDVATGEQFRRVGPHQVAQKLTQAIDAVHAFLGQFVCKERHLVVERGGSSRRFATDAVVAPDQVVMLRARDGFGVDVAVFEELGLFRHDAPGQVDFGPGIGVLVNDPVKAKLGKVHMRTFTLHQDIVAAFPVKVVVVRPAPEDVVTDDTRCAEVVVVVAKQEVIAVAAFNPVVAFTAIDHIGAGPAKNEVVAHACEGMLAVVGSHHDDIVALTAKDQFRSTTAGRNHVVAVFAMQEADVVTVPDDVVAFATAEGVDARTADQQVVAVTTPERIVAQAADKDVALRRAAQHHMLAAVELQQVVVFKHTLHERGIDSRRCTFDKACAHAGKERIDVGRDRIRDRLHGLVHLEDILHRGEDVGRDMRAAFTDVGVAHDHRGEGVVFKLADHVHAVGAAQVVEAVTVLQVLHLVLEYEAEARPQHAAEWHDGFRQATDPELDIVDAGFAGGPDAGSVDIVQTVRRRAFATQHKGRSRCALVVHGHGGDDCLMRAVSGNEVHDRGRVLQIGGIVGPAFVGAQEFAAGCGKELLACFIQRGHAGVTAARDVQRSKVKRQTDKVVTQRAGDELVDIGPDFTRHAACHRTCSLIRGQDPILIEGHRVEEGGDQVGRGVDAVRVHGLDVLGQHRVAEAIDHMSELGKDRGVDFQRAVHHEHTDLRLHAAAELFEGQVLILHFGRELGDLEQALAIPGQGCGRCGCNILLSDRRHQPFVDEGQLATGKNGLLHLVDLTVMLGVENVVDGGQAEVLVAAAVTRDVVAIQQFVVIGLVLAELVRDDGVAGFGIRVRCLDGGFAGEAIHDIGAGGRVMGDILEEGVTVAQCLCGIDRVGQVTLDQDMLGRAVHDTEVGVCHDKLRQAVRTGDEVAIGVGGQQRTIQNIGVGQVDAQKVTGLRLDVAPCGHAAACAVQQMTGGHRHAIIQRIFAQEDLVRRVRGVGLVLIDPWRGLVEVLAHVIGGAQDPVGTGLVRRAGQHHEVGGRTFDVKRIIRLQRNIDGAAAALADEVETVVEELAEQRHPRVVGRRKTFIRRDVGQAQVVAVHFDGVCGQQRVQCGLRCHGCGFGRGGRSGHCVGGVHRREVCGSRFQRSLRQCFGGQGGVQVA